MSDYNEKLRDSRWIQKKDSILRRDDFTCFDCGKKSDRLLVYHLSSNRLRDPWDYPDDQYLTLCLDCRSSRRWFTENMLNTLRISLGRVRSAHLPELVDKFNSFAKSIEVNGGAK